MMNINQKKKLNRVKRYQINIVLLFTVVFTAGCYSTVGYSSGGYGYNNGYYGSTGYYYGSTIYYPQYPRPVYRPPYYGGHRPSYRPPHHGGHKPNRPSYKPPHHGGHKPNRPSYRPPHTGGNKPNRPSYRPPSHSKPHNNDRLRQSTPFNSNK